MRIIELKCKSCGNLEYKYVDDHDRDRNIARGAVGERVRKAFGCCSMCNKDFRINNNKPC